MKTYVWLALALAGNVHAATGVSVAASPSTTVLQDLSTIELPARLRLPAPKASDRIGSDAAVAEALTHNPGIMSSRAKLESARGEYRHNTAANNPIVNFGGSYLPEFRPGVDSDAARDFPDRDLTYLQYVFPTSGRRRYATRAATGKYTAAVADLESAELDLVASVRAAYADLQVSENVIAAQEDTWRIAVRFSDLAARQFKAGAVPQSNVSRAEVEEARAEQDLVRSHADLVSKRQALLFSLGRGVSSAVSAADPLATDVAIPALATLDEVAQARPELRSARAQIASLRAQIDVARADRRPDLTLQATPSDVVSNSGGIPYKAFVTLPLWDRGLISGTVAQARGDLKAAEWNLVQVQNQIHLDVTRAYQQLEAARAVLHVLEERTVPISRRLLDQASVSYVAGAAPLFDVLDAQRVYRLAVVDQLNARGDVRRALAQLERAIGGPLPKR